MDIKRVIEHITSWLKDYSIKAGTQGFVVGVSGGIDSAVASALGAHTDLPLLVVEMPIHQSEEQVGRAQEHINWLRGHWPKTYCAEVHLTNIFDSFIKAVPPVDNETDREMSLVNTRARLRMATLYYFAALDYRLVLGTGNKVEDFGIGFFTKHGDGGVDISPIADLTKTEVYEVARELGICESILEAPPTDGLWGDNRTDEEQIGASYPELEWAMEFEGNEQELDDRQRNVLSIYRELNRANKHKMEPIPVCTIPAELR